MNEPPLIELPSGQPKECWVRPGRCFSGATCQISLRPIPNFGVAVFC